MGEEVAVMEKKRIRKRWQGGPVNHDVSKDNN